MHIIVSWDIKTDSQRREEIDNAMKQALHGYSWLQPISMFYILEIASTMDWNVIQGRLLSIAQIFSTEVNFLISPVYEAETDYFVFNIPADDFYRQA